MRLLKDGGTCRELLSGETELWAFVRVEGVEPKHKDAEQPLRDGLIYRKLRGGATVSRKTPPR